jgi:drug/metabolite transporter (DMT)-like permease
MQGNLLLSAIFVVTTVLANVAQNIAVRAVGPIRGAATLRELLPSPFLWAGMASYVVALCSYLMLLSRVPLNIATSIAALNFVAVQLAARFVFGEQIPSLRYLGFACIVVGIWIVSVTQRPAA